MSDSTTNLDTVSVSQAQKEVTVNALANAASPATYFARRDYGSAGLTWAYYGGVITIAGVPTRIVNGTKTLTASSTNYLYISAAGAVTQTTSIPSGWPGALESNAIALYDVVTNGSMATSWNDYRNPIYAQSVVVAAALAAMPVQPFDALAFYPGVPTASALVVRIPVARTISLAANFSGSYGAASAAATGSTAFDIKKNGSSIGTATFAASATTCTFVTAGGVAQSLAAGDILSIVAPASPDATLADIGFVLAGTR